MIGFSEKKSKRKEKPRAMQLTQIRLGVIDVELSSLIRLQVLRFWKIFSNILKISNGTSLVLMFRNHSAGVGYAILVMTR